MSSTVPCHRRRVVDASRDFVKSLSRDGDALFLKISRQICNQLQLLVDGQTANDGLENPPNGHIIFTNQAAIIDVSEDTHQKPEQVFNDFS